jgi:hypothetical protein
VSEMPSEVTGMPQIVVDVHDERIYDVVRDVAVARQVTIRSLRSRSKSLEDIYLGNVNASREVAGVS